MSDKYEVVLTFDTKEAAHIAQNVVYRVLARTPDIRKVNPDARPE